MVTPPTCTPRDTAAMQTLLATAVVLGVCNPQTTNKHRILS